MSKMYAVLRGTNWFCFPPLSFSSLLKPEVRIVKMAFCNGLPDFPSLVIFLFFLFAFLRVFVFVPYLFFFLFVFYSPRFLGLLAPSRGPPFFRAPCLPVLFFFHHNQPPPPLCSNQVSTPYEGHTYLPILLVLPYIFFSARHSWPPIDGSFFF